MTDKLVSHKRPMFKQARVAQKHLAKPEPQPVTRKQSLRPLTALEKREILRRAIQGHTCQNIASVLGIPFVLVQREIKAHSTIVEGKIGIFHLSVEKGKQVAVITIDGIRYVIPAKIYARIQRDLYVVHRNNFSIELRVMWNEENFVVLDARAAKAGAS